MGRADCQRWSVVPVKTGHPAQPTPQSTAGLLQVKG